MSATTAPNDIWKLTPTRLAGSSSKTTKAASAQIRIDSRSRSMRIAAKTMPVMMKARWVGIAAPGACPGRRVPGGHAAAAAAAADGGETGVALDVAPARQELGRRRVEEALEADPVARLQRIAGRGDMKAQAVRLRISREAGER